MSVFPIGFRFSLEFGGTALFGYPNDYPEKRAGAQVGAFSGKPKTFLLSEPQFLRLIVLVFLTLGPNSISV